MREIDHKLLLYKLLSITLEKIQGMNGSVNEQETWLCAGKLLISKASRGFINQ